MGRSSFMQWLQGTQRKEPKLAKVKPKFSWDGPDSRVVNSILNRKVISQEFESTVPRNM